MKPTERVNTMLSLCRAVLGGDTPSLDELSQESAAELYALSHHHDLAHLVSCALFRAGRLDITSEIGAKFQKSQMIAVFRYENQRVELENICKTLEEAGIDFVPLKGSELRSLYPEPWMRTSSDIDVLVHAEQLSAAQAALCEQLDYKNEHGSDHDVSLMTPSGVHVELHFDLMEDDRLSEAAATILNEVWSHATPAEGNKHRHELSDAMFYYYHIAHMAKHFYGGGCGVRSFADLWLLIHRKEYDAAAREALIARGNLTAFERTAVCVADAWFSGTELSETARDVAAYILRGGTFGVAENRTAVHRSRGESKFRYVTRSIFMPYEQLCAYYPSLKGRKWLTFFYQIRRIFRLLREGKLKSGVHEIRAAGATDEEKIDRARDLLDRLGL